MKDLLTILMLLESLLIIAKYLRARMKRKGGHHA